MKRRRGMTPVSTPRQDRDPMTPIPGVVKHAPSPLTSEEQATMDFWFTGPRLTDPFKGNGYTYRVNSYVNPDEHLMDDISRVVATQSKCRITIETWERKN